MAKDPAILWYWADWHSGTSLMSRFLKGCYIDLLHAQFTHGRLSLEEIKTCLGADFGSSWPTLQKKFKQDQNELFFNERLENEKMRRQKFSESRRENINKRYSTLEPTHVEHMNLHMENKNENTIENENKKKGIQGENDLSGEEILKTIEFVDRVKQVKLSEGEVVNFWKAFELNIAETAYLSHSKKLNHFRNWLKNQKNGYKSYSTGNNSSRDRQAAARAALRDQIGNILAGTA